jgi:hypothetical protein
VAATALPPAADPGCASGILPFGGPLFTVGTAAIPEASTTGAYSLALPPGAYNVDANRELLLEHATLDPSSGNLRFPVPGLPLQLATDLVQDFVVPPLPGTVLISGTVTDGLGQPVAGASVHALTSLITNTPNADFTTETETDSDGKYALLALSGTSYRLVVCPPVSDTFGVTTGP